MSDQYIAVVNFHYIREEASHKGIHAISVDDFNARLDAIHKEGFEFISLRDLHWAIENQSLERLGDKSCLISFDDGLKESYVFGLSALNKKGIPAVFYVITDGVYKQKVMDVHKMHYVRSRIADSDILKKMAEHINIDELNLNSDQLQRQYPWDDQLAARVKYIFNFIVDEVTRMQIVDQLFNQSFEGGEGQFACGLYMDSAQVKDLADKGYLGTHSSRHQVLANLEEKDLNEDIQDSIDVLLKNTDTRVSSISYPYGERSAVNDFVAQTAKECGLTSGMTMFRGVNYLNDVINNPFMLKRLDMNDMIGGKSQQVYKEVVRGV